MLAAVFTHIDTQIRRNQTKHRFIDKNQPMEKSVDIQRQPLSSIVQRTVMYTMSKANHKMQSTMMGTIKKDYVLPHLERKTGFIPKKK